MQGSKICSIFPLVAILSLLLRVSLAFEGNQGHLADGHAVLDTNSTGGNSDEVRQFEEWKKSSLYLASFDDQIISIPDVQREFIKDMVVRDQALFKEILEEAIKKRNSFAPSVSLMWKYSAKLLGNLIRNRRLEQQISPRLEPKQEFFESLAKLAETILDKSAILKKENGYTKSNVNTESLSARFSALLEYLGRTVNASPVGAYLKWDEFILFKGETSNPNHDKLFLEEASDLTALFRGMGYEGCTFVARRVVNLLRMFSRGLIPSDKEV